MINIDISDKDIEVSTHGGEYYSEEFSYAGYTIELEDLQLTISPKTAVSLYNVLGGHLKANGRTK